jgi:L-methionine (R)-S-oxide reductase
MTHDFKINASEKIEKYRELIPQMKHLLTGENDLIAKLGNVCAALKFGMDFFWVGFYLVKGNELVLGPFQGPVACTRIGLGKGVCGKAWEQQKTLIVPDVDKFPGHIACSSLSKSEIVLPVFDSDNKVVAVLDVDSEKLDHFDENDERYLKEIISLINFGKE